MRISISDDLADRLTPLLKGAQATVEKEVERRVAATIGQGRFIVLHEADMAQLAELLGTQLPISTKPDLASACRASGQVHLGHKRLEFTPPQLQQIKERATRAGYPLDEFIARVASKVMTEIFLIQPADGPQVVIREGWEDLPAQVRTA
jgi:hypothetical protein